MTSLATAVTMTVAPGSLPKIAQYLVSPALLVATLFVRAHVSNFWKGKAKVPFVDGYVCISVSLSICATLMLT